MLKHAIKRRTYSCNIVHIISTPIINVILFFVNHGEGTFLYLSSLLYVSIFIPNDSGRLAFLVSTAMLNIFSSLLKVFLPLILTFKSPQPPSLSTRDVTDVTVWIGLALSVITCAVCIFCRFRICKGNCICNCNCNCNCSCSCRCNFTSVHVSMLLKTAVLTARLRVENKRIVSTKTNPAR